MADLVSALPTLPTIPANTYYVTNYGAIGNGVTTNTTAIQAAINAASTAGGGTVEITPATNAYMCGPLTLKGSINLHIDGGALLRMLPYGSYPGSASFIGATNVNDVEISGSGAIDGQGFAWWAAFEANSSLARPIMIRFQGCNRQLIQNVTLSNSPMFHISISSSKGNATVQSVTEVAPSSSDPTNPSHNTDACDVSGTNILVQNCNFSVGDDDFTCSGGTSGILLTNNAYGNGHGISIGSYTDSGGVSNMTVINCTITGADNGIRIKSDDGRGGLVQNISYCNVNMTNVHLPIQIYSYYNEVGIPNSISPYHAATQSVASVTSTTPIYRNITFSNITATYTIWTSVSNYPVGIIWARTELPATNIVFNKINLTGDKSFCLYNVSGAQFIDPRITVSAGTNTLALFNAQFVVTNSAPTTNLFTLDGISTNSYANNLALYNAKAALSNTNALGNSPLLTVSGSTLTISNNLALTSSSVLNFGLGTNSTTVGVTSNLVLSGTLNVADGGGFAHGKHLLFTYGLALTTNNLSFGTMPAGYNYFIDTNTFGQIFLAANLMVTSPPVANPDTYYRAKGASLKIRVSDLLANDTDPDGYYPITFTGVSLVTTNGVTLITNSTTIFYTNNANVADSFTYTITDANGKNATGTVYIFIASGVTGQLTGPITVNGGTVTATFGGIPGTSYYVQRATNVSFTLGISNFPAQVAPVGGLFQVQDSFGDLGSPPSQAFYRLMLQ